MRASSRARGGVEAGDPPAGAFERRPPGGLQPGDRLAGGEGDLERPDPADAVVGVDAAVRLGVEAGQQPREPAVAAGAAVEPVEALPQARVGRRPLEDAVAQRPEVETAPSHHQGDGAAAP